MRRWLAALLLGLASACAAVTALAADPAGEPTDDERQQVLVLLRAPPEHFRPDSAYSGQYGSGVGRSARRAVAAQLAHEHQLKLVTDWPMPVLGVDCYVMQLPSGPNAEHSPAQVAEALSRDPRVDWAQPMNLYRAQAASPPPAPAHNDPLYAAQPAVQAWHLSELHELATGRDVRVAVVDSGVELSHPDLLGQVVLSENFVVGRPYAAERHGTAVAGIIAARADNGVGIAGIAPQARLLVLRGCWQESPDLTRCSSLSLANALQFAITHGAQVVNLSLSGPKDRLLGQLLDAALARGITVVAAADPAADDGGFPASHAGVWAVTDDIARARHGTLLAPGRDVPTATPNGSWQVVSGASYASAHVAGLAALLRELGGASAVASAQASLVVMPAGDIATCETLLRVAGPRNCACALERYRSVAGPAAALGLGRP